MSIKIGVDLGQSGVKIVGEAGMVEFASMAALIGNTSVDAPVPGRRAKRPMVVSGEKIGEMFVGHGAHRWGMPVENFDFSRLAGVTPEMRAIFYGALTEYQRRYGKFNDTVEVIIGLPIQMLTGDNKEKYVRQVKGWIGGEHHWLANNDAFDATITKVGLLPQATGAVVDYAFDMQGNAISEEHNKALTKENATLWIGSSTVELQVTQREEDTKRFNGGAPIGVRWLHNQVDPNGLYSFGEFDAMLRENDLPDGMDIQPFLSPWSTQIFGFTSRKWNEAYQRFYRIFVGGGGSIPLKNELLAHFNGKIVFASDPIMSIARGLYKAALRMK
jgi:hypothetical protein